MKRIALIIIIFFSTTISVIAQVREVDEEFIENITIDKPLVIDFYADWCGPCAQQMPIIEDLSREFKGQVDFYKVNIDDNQDIVKKLEMPGIPYVLVIYNIERDYFYYTGLTPKAKLRKMIRKAIEKWNEN